MTNTFTCSKGHISTESDYCSECGVKIAGVGALEAQVLGTSGSIQICPDCSAPHELNVGDFCEICGYNFTNGKSNQLAIAVDPIKEISKAEAPKPVLTGGWELVVTIDPSLRHPESPEPPTNQPPIIFPLKQPTNLIGRSNQARAIYPDIALDFDNAVSHRHAVLNRQEDGTFTLRDIGSSNGTQFKGEELTPMVDIPLADGDEFTLGHWTRIVIKGAKL